MAKVKAKDSKGALRPALTPEARENQMISLAVDLAEKQLREGTASSQVITHFLKLGSSKEKLEKEILEKQKEIFDPPSSAAVIEAYKQNIAEFEWRINVAAESAKS